MHIDLEIKNYRCFEDAEPARLTLSPGITAIIGTNNAGKSALLRFFYELRSVFGTLKDASSWDSFHQGGKLGGGVQVQDAQSVFCRRNSRDLSITLKLDRLALNPKTAFDGVTLVLERQSGNLALRELFLDGRPASMTSSPKTRSPSDSPVYRLCQAFQLLHESIYVPVFRTPIPGGNTNLFDMPLGGQFVRVWEEASLGYNVAKRELCRDVEEQAARLLGVESCRLTVNQDRSALLVDIGKQSLPIDEVGGGISQILMILAVAAMNRPQLLLCDEPEASLHPALQIAFASAVAKYATHSSVFATHSLGLARSIANTILTVSHDGRRSILRHLGAESDASDILGALQYTAARELGYDTILLVEGSTEVLTFHQWLRWFGLDHRVVVLSLGGSNMVSEQSKHALNEVRRLSSRVWAVIDSEKASEESELSKERSKFVEVCESLGFHVHVLKRRGLENYLPERAIREEKGNAYRALKPYERLQDCDPSWAKSDNWRIAAAMEQGELDIELERVLNELKGER